MKLVLSTARVRTLLPALSVAMFFGLASLGPAGCTKGDGVIHGDVTVYSPDRNTWLFYSFENEDLLRDVDGNPLQLSNPATHGGWDLAISQWVIATASGDSVFEGASDSRGALLAVEGSVGDWPSLDEFDANCADYVVAGTTDNTQAISCQGGNSPSVDSGWIADSIDDPDGAGPFPAVAYHPSVTFWFEYQFSGHEVVPYGNIYVVEARNGGCVKLQITDYYDEDGENGHVSFSWAWLGP